MVTYDLKRQAILTVPIIKEEFCQLLCSDIGMCGNNSEVGDGKNGVEPMVIRKRADEVHGHSVKPFIRDGEWMKGSNRF
jgi:hypothetical protein